MRRWNRPAPATREASGKNKRAEPARSRTAPPAPARPRKATHRRPPARHAAKPKPRRTKARPSTHPRPHRTARRGLHPAPTRGTHMPGLRRAAHLVTSPALTALCHQTYGR